MKKILLQKGRDEVSQRATPQPARDPEPPITDKSTSSPGEHQKRTPSSVESLQIATAGSNRVPTPSSEHHHPPPRTDFPALLPTVTSLPVSSLPLLMLPIPSRSGANLDKYYLGESNRGAFGLQPHAYSGFYQIGEGRFPGISPSRLLQYGKPVDEEHVDYQVLRQESPYSHHQNTLNVPLRSVHEEAVARMRKSAELQQRFDESRDYSRAGFAGMVSVEAMRREVAMETMRRDVAMDLVSSSNIVEVKNCDSVDVVEVDSEDEDRRMRSRSIARSMDDPVDDELPRMIDKARQMSPPERTDAQDDSKTASPRSDLHESFKSPAASGNQKTVYRPKGRPTKAAAASAAGGGAGDGGGPGARSIIRCPVCAKQFNNSSALAKHKLTHSDERKYACTLCNKAFKRQDHLNGHMMTHSSMKPFACKFIGCNKSYCDARSLRRHMENHHQECSNTTSAAGSSAGFFSFEGSSFQQGYGAEGATGASDASLSYLQQVSPISPVGGLRGSPQTSSSRQFGGGGGIPQGQMWVTGYNPLDEPKPVKCHVCGRGFKNIPALNGHMRLHGGYVRKDQENVDESQDVSRSSDARTESRFSQSENSQSSASVSDRQHESLPGPSTSFAAGSRPGSSEPGRRHFYLSPASAEADVGRGGLEKLLVVEREEVRGRVEEARSRVEEFRGHALYERFGLPDRCGARTAGCVRETGEFRVGDSVPLDVGGEFETRGRRYGDLDQLASVKCTSPRKEKKHEEEFPRNFSFKSRQSGEERPAIVQIMRLAGHQTVSGVEKLSEYSGYSTAFEHDRVKSESHRSGPISVGISHGHQFSSTEKQPRKVRVVEEATMPPLVSDNPAKPSAATEGVSVKAGGAEFQSTAGGPTRHLKASHRIDCIETSQRKREKTRDEKVSASGDECFPDSTSGRDDISGGNADKKMRGAKLEQSPFTDSDRQTEVKYAEPNIPMSDGDMRRRVADPAPEEGYLSAHSPPRAVLSPSTRQSACLYRKRWMDLQLKQSGQGCPETSGDCPPQGSNCGASTYGTGTDCGDPSTFKVNHKASKETTSAHPLSDQNRHVRNAVGNCLSGNGATSFSPHRSSPTSPVFQTSPLAWKRGGSSTFNYPAVGDVGTATVHNCHNGLTPREGLHHVHSNSCITHTDPGSYVQSHIPCSPYDPRPQTPCAAHTPFTPCQPYTPHTPYTPCAVNRPSTPKHASHFEFPPRICLQESSMCDSPYPGNSQAQLPGQQVEIRLVVEPEDRPYRPMEKFGTEAELLRQHGYGDRRDMIGATDIEIDRPRKHLQTESDSRLNLLWQRDFDRQKQHHTGTGHPGLQNEARNPEDGFAASLPTGAKRNSPGLAHNSTTEKPEKMERKRKPSEDLPIPVEMKRCVTDRAPIENRNSAESTGRDSRGGEQVSSSCGVQFKTEEHMRMEDSEHEQSESDRPKGLRVGSVESYDVETVFRNPPSPLKVKKCRPRPEPLFIPANVNHFGFQSRLRSPRLWDGLAKQMAPPYTPPPMLSPARSGSGLFWKLHSEFHSPLTGPPVLPKFDKAKFTSSWPEVTPPLTADVRQPPETDLQPHINIGPQYQPDLPQFRGSKPRGQDYINHDDHSTLVWTPSTAARLKEEEVTQYLQYACCAIIPGNGANQEYAMHLLHLCKGDMKKAVKLLLEPEPKLPRSSGLKTYKYQDCVKWKRIEIDLFHKAIMKLDKDFFQISKMVGSKSVKDCVQFYYLWKKICPDELKQLKVLRRKREQFELYNRRSKDHRGQPLKQPTVQQSQKSAHEKSNNGSRSSKRHEQMESLGFQYQDSTGKPVALKEEQMEDSDAEKQWCSICKRSFTSARNFSVHVKMHERSRTRREQAELDVAKLPYSKLGSSF